LKPSPIGRDSSAHEVSLTPKGAAQLSGAHQHPVLPCLYAERATFIAKPDPDLGYPEIRVSLYEFGGAARLHDGLDIGGGIGFAQFEHDDVAGSEVTNVKLTLTPIRVSLRPLLFVVPEGKWTRLGNALTIYWKQLYISGPIRGSDFGQMPPPGEPEFREGSAIPSSFGITIDVTAFLPR
jgi:hypothetical protein